MIHSKFWSATLQPYHTFVMWPQKTYRFLQGRRSKFRVYHLFFISFLLIFDCIIRFHYFFCWFLNVSCVFNTCSSNLSKMKDLSCILLTFGSRWVQMTLGGFRWLQLASGKVQVSFKQLSGGFQKSFRHETDTDFRHVSNSFQIGIFQAGVR